MAKKNDGQNLVTQEFRVSFPHLFTPQKPKNSTQGPKYSVTMLFPKDTDLSELKKCIEAAKVNKWGARPKTGWPKTIKSPVSDGDHSKHAEREGYQGCWVIKASTGENFRPSVIGMDKKPVKDQAVVYPGCWGRAAIRAIAYDNEFGKGVSFILDHVMKIRDDESFSGKQSADEAFAGIDAVNVADEDFGGEDFGAEGSDDGEQF